MTQSGGEIGAKAVRRLASLVQLERMARRCAGFKEFGFFIVNETVRFLPYDRAVFWYAGESGVCVQSVSSVPVLDEESPFIAWMKRATAFRLKQSGAEQCRLLEKTDVSDALARDWDAFNSPSVLWMPFVSPVTHKVEGGLWLSRKKPPFEKEEAGVALLVAEAFGSVFSVWKSAGRVPLPAEKSKKKRMIAVAAVVLCALFPVRTAVVAPAEVVADAPRYITAPMSGVVKEFFVEPAQSIKKGDLLFSFDDAELRSRLNLSEKALAAAGEEYKKAAQQSFSSPEVKARLPLIRLEIEKAKDERAYLQELVKRSSVRASADGTAVFSGTEEFVGRPVMLGERVMMLADPQKTALRAFMPVSDAIDVQTGADIRFYMYAFPEKPLKAKAVSTAFEAGTVPEGFLAYRVDAAFSEPAHYRIGTRGIAKIYGGRVPFFYYALRHPLAALRQWFGI